MLKLSQCEVNRSRTRPVSTGVTSVEEGLGLVAVRENGVLTVKPSTGAANTDEFAGVALNERTAPALFPLVYQATVVLLSAGVWGFKIPKAIVGVPQIRYASNNVVVTEYTADSDSLLEAGEYKINGLQVEMVVGELGKVINLVYNYAPTVTDLMYLGGDNSPTTFAPISSVLGLTSVIESGVVYTSNYDVTIDWASWTPAIGLKSVANGMITTSAGTGAVIAGRVVEAPSIDSPFLGFSFSVA